jgi:hypothetical protein
MSRQLHRRPGSRVLAAVTAVTALALGAAACSSSSANSAGGGKVTVSIDCAPTQAQNAVLHKEWLEDVATFEKRNPTKPSRSRRRCTRTTCTRVPTGRLSTGWT